MRTHDTGEERTRESAEDISSRCVTDSCTAPCGTASKRRGGGGEGRTHAHTARTSKTMVASLEERSRLGESSCLHTRSTYSVLRFRHIGR